MLAAGSPRLLDWGAWQGDAVPDPCPEAECGSGPEMNWEAAEMGRDFPFPSGRRGDSNLPLLSHAKTISGFIAGTDGWSSTAQSKSCTQVSAGGKEGQLHPLSAATCSDEKHDPLCYPAEKSKPTPATYQKSAQLCLPWKTSPALRCRERQER